MMLIRDAWNGPFVDPYVTAARGSGAAVAALGALAGIFTDLGEPETARECAALHRDMAALLARIDALHEVVERGAPVYAARAVEANRKACAAQLAKDRQAAADLHARLNGTQTGE